MKRCMSIRAAVMTFVTAAVVFLFSSCERNSYRVFSTKYRVMFTCDMSQPPFRQAADTPGRFIMLRRGAGNLTVTDPEGKSTEVELTQQQNMTFCLGLAGLILGKPTFNNEKQEVWAFDLACPECDMESHRLSVSIDGFATCSHCGNSWNLNNGGFPTSSGPRTLYRYPTSAFGTTLTVSN